MTLVETAPILVEGVSKRYQTPSGPVAAVDGVSMTVRGGEFVSLLGPSGRDVGGAPRHGVPYAALGRRLQGPRALRGDGHRVGAVGLGVLFLEHMNRRPGRWR